MNREQMVELRELFLSLAETADELIALEDREEKGEEIKEEEVNQVVGKFMTNMIKLQALDSK
ncbi:hypothetical protein AALJ34_17000 [Paraclostridium bifermentans]|uniref:hypothetical protein n=1 Tax=Paraclostridium bifermentans TaxID=1490 RepID=UPI001C12866C|nr:hypothetical protein [Paraclostridium bifermentans]MBU5290001.1 hypothetical protein [Paraclostridium bifermentans]